MYAGYDLLPADIKKKIEGKRAIHNFTFSRKRRHGEDPLTAEQSAKVPPVAHPIVRTHPDTGRKAIFLGDHAESIEGMEYEEGRALIEEINVLTTPPVEHLFAHLGAARMHGVGQSLHAAPRHRVRRGEIHPRDAPLHDRRRQAG